MTWVYGKMDVEASSRTWGTPKTSPLYQIINLPGIVEIFGESGSGKTQLCQYLSAFYLQSEECKRALWISVEHKFDTRRFIDFVQQNSASELQDEICGRLLIHEEFESDALHNFITQHLSEVVSTRHVGLLVIDSLAAAFRLNEGSEESASLFQIATELRKIVADYKCTVLCTNQVSAYFEGALEDGNYDELYRRLGIKPALGHSWTNCVSHRFVMVKSGQNLRSLKSVYSPLLPDVWCAKICLSDFSAS